MSISCQTEFKTFGSLFSLSIPRRMPSGHIEASIRSSPNVISEFIFFKGIEYIDQLTSSVMHAWRCQNDVKITWKLTLKWYSKYDQLTLKRESKGTPSKYQTKVKQCSKMLKQRSNDAQTALKQRSNNTQTMLKRYSNEAQTVLKQLV